MATKKTKKKVVSKASSTKKPRKAAVKQRKPDDDVVLIVTPGQLQHLRRLMNVALINDAGNISQMIAERNDVGETEDALYDRIVSLCMEHNVLCSEELVITLSNEFDLKVLSAEESDEDSEDE